MLALLVLVQTNAALWAHMVTTTDSGQSVVAIGLRDMIAMQHGADAPMAAIVLGGATVEPRLTLLYLLATIELFAFPLLGAGTAGVSQTPELRTVSILELQSLL